MPGANKIKSMHAERQYPRRIRMFPIFVSVLRTRSNNSLSLGQKVTQASCNMSYAAMVLRRRGRRAEGQDGADDARWKPALKIVHAETPVPWLESSRWSVCVIPGLFLIARCSPPASLLLTLIMWWFLPCHVSTRVCSVAAAQSDAFFPGMFDEYASFSKFWANCTRSSVHLQ
jgi:hypothetical protein